MTWRLDSSTLRTSLNDNDNKNHDNDDNSNDNYDNNDDNDDNNDDIDNHQQQFLQTQFFYFPLQFPA